MPEPRPLVSPVLVGRDDLLALADRRRSEAALGRGGLLLLAGEAGIGKTRLAGALERRAVADGFAVARGATYPGDVDVAAGVLLDLARSIRRGAATRETGEALADRLERAGSTAADVGGDLHRRRRLLVLDVVDLLADAPARSGRPVLLVLEDLHWADDLSLEVVAALARRLPELPLLILGTVRSDELYPTMPVRTWRSRLLTSRLAEEARVSRLDRDATATMVSVLRATGLPAPRDLVDAIHARSDGVPLHIEELVALAGAGHGGGMAAGDMDRAGAASGHTAGLDAGQAGTGGAPPVPDSLEDAVLRRAERLSTRSRRTGDAAAVIGRSFDAALLARVIDRSVEALGTDLAELERSYFVTASPDGIRLDFRHALIRDALYTAVDAGTRRRLHARVADATADDPRFGPAFRSVHLELAGRGEAAFEAALAGAARAVGLSAHREARDLLDRALRTMPANLDTARRAGVLGALADEAAATDDNATADARYAEATGLLRAAGDEVAAAELVPRHVAVRHLLGDGLEARAERLEAAIAAVDRAIGAAGDRAAASDQERAARARARLLAGLSAAHMLDRRLEAAIRYGGQGRALAAGLGDVATELDVAATVGSCLVFAGHMEDGWAMLEDAVARSRAARFEAQAARSYRMHGSCASVLVDYDRAEPVLRDGIAYAEAVELWNHRHYLAAHLAHVCWATGAWGDAEGIAAHALADGRGGITTRITALYVLGYVALGRGQDERAGGLLGEALGLAEGMGELQRVSPVLWGLAERARLRGDPADAIAWCLQAAVASAAVDDAAYLFPFLVTGVRAHLALGDVGAAEGWVARLAPVIERRAIPGTLTALAHARGLVALARGSSGPARELLDAAVHGWSTRRRAWEAAGARLDLAVLHARANRVPEALRLAEAASTAAGVMGAAPLADEAASLLRRLRARAPVERPWAPLTARELEVARRISRGGTNAEIAAGLGVSVRTVTAHVEHILAKLGATRRAEVAAWVVRAGADASAPDGAGPDPQGSG
jgi:DNA-binding CsgD family transcriptional regulator